MSLQYLFFHLLIVVLLFSCASQGPPTGGPIDRQGPRLISVQPPNESLNIASDQKIMLTFNELLDPVSIPISIQIESDQDYKLKIRVRRIIIQPKSTWFENSLLRINLSRKIRDYQKNIMSEPIQLVYSTGNYIPEGNISGNITGYNPKKIIEVGLYQWPLVDSNMTIQKVEADENGFFKFKFIDYGEYTIGAIEAVLTDFGKQMRRKKYAILSSDYILLSSENTKEHVQMLLSEPLEKLKITSIQMLSQYCANLLMSDQSEEIFIIDTLHAPGDSVKVNIVKSNRLETYPLPEFVFVLPVITDTTGPIYKNFDFVSDSLSLIFSEPVHLDANALLIDRDSLDIPIDFIMQNSYTVLIPYFADSIQNIKLLGEYIQDWNENAMADSVKKILIHRTKIEENIIVGGNILGTVKYEGKQPLIVEAHEIEGGDIYSSKVEKQKFKLENLQTGMYELWGFEIMSKHTPTIYYSGLWEPYQRAAQFAIHPDTIDVRAHWDIEGIIISFE